MEEIDSLVGSMYQWFAEANFFKVFFYSYFVPFAVLFAKESVAFLHRKWFSKHERDATEVQELHTKVHDRLCELYVDISANSQSESFGARKLRMNYAAARLGKYDSELKRNIETLVSKLSSRLGKGRSAYGLETDLREIENLLDDVRNKLDTLWRKKC